MLKVTEQRPMNNEYVNSRISKLSPGTLAGIFKNLQQIFINVANKKPRGQLSNVLYRVSQKIC